MDYPLALFRYGGSEDVDGVPVTSCVVLNVEQLEAAQADGWHRSAPEALAAHEAKLAEDEAEATAKRETAEDSKPPTRPELEAKAKELGIAFKPQTSSKQLLAAIEAKLAEKTE